VRHRFSVCAVEGYESAMATAGGVSLDEIDPASMESRLVPGLYFCGELCAFTGDTGGYNIHAAFATGRLAGLSAARSANGTR